MCNLYSITKGQQAIRQLTLALSDTTGNLPSRPAVFPDYATPVVRNDRDGGRELTMMRWGFPPPPNLGSQPVTNVRNVKSPYWRGWLKPEWRVVVPHLLGVREHAAEEDAGLVRSGRDAPAILLCRDLAPLHRGSKED